MPTKIANERSKWLQARRKREAELKAWWDSLSREDQLIVDDIALADAIARNKNTADPFEL